MTKPDALMAYLFDGKPHPLSGSLSQWAEASPRFTLFAETYRDKIRKKIRAARQPDRLLDLRSELEVAFCLLSDRRLALAYEPYASKKRRGPDFTVTYRLNLTFNLEVARLHTGENGQEDAVDLPSLERPVLRILLDKLGQMQPSMPNLLVVRTGDELARRIDLGGLMQQVKTRAEAKDPAFYALSRYTSPSAFFKDYLRLSAILLWSDDVQPWVNKQARPGLEEKLLRLVSAAARSCRR